MVNGGNPLDTEKKAVPFRGRVGCVPTPTDIYEFLVGMRSCCATLNRCLPAYMGYRAAEWTRESGTASKSGKKQFADSSSMGYNWFEMFP